MDLCTLCKGGGRELFIATVATTLNLKLARNRNLQTLQQFLRRVNKPPKLEDRDKQTQNKWRIKCCRL